MYWIISLLIALGVVLWCCCALWKRLASSQRDVAKLRIAEIEARKECAEWAARVDELETELESLKESHCIAKEAPSKNLEVEIKRLIAENELLEYKLSRKPGRKKPMR